LPKPKHFPRFSVTTAEEGRTGAVLWAVLVSLFFDRERAVLRWAEEQPRELRLDEIGESYGRYRLHVPELERSMMRSLKSYGQLSPIVMVRQEGRWELIDGFKRLGAARSLPSMDRLLARQIEVDERRAKAAIYGLNRTGGRTASTSKYLTTIFAYATLSWRVIWRWAEADGGRHGREQMGESIEATMNSLQVIDSSLAGSA
jgi:hypothetical protein